MEARDIIELFFSFRYEKQINDNILNDVEYAIDEYGVLNYVANLVNVPYISFLNYAKENFTYGEITSKNITQSSSFSACEKEMIDALLSVDNKGLDFCSIGKLFPKYVRSQNDVAYRKYGENQIKTATQLGLTFEYYNHWYLNCVGYIYNKIPNDDKLSLIARNLLRDNLYGQLVISITEKPTDILDFMGSLKSYETIYRRYECVLRLLTICVDVCKKEGIYTYPIIDRKQWLIDRIKENKKNK